MERRVRGGVAAGCIRDDKQTRETGGPADTEGWHLISAAMACLPNRGDKEACSSQRGQRHVAQ